MMRFIEGMSSRDRRALTLGFLLAAPVLGYVAVIRPYVRAEQALMERIDAQRELLARERYLLDHADEMPAQLARARSAVSQVGRRLYDGREPVAATAALARDIRDAFEDAGVITQRIESRDGELGKDGLRQLTIEVNAEGDFEGVLSALAALEASDKLIHVRRLSVTQGSIALAAAGTGPALTVSATISGYAR
jgi:type II secretory pathway component PulM